MVIVIGENFFDGLQVVFGSMLVWSEVRASSQHHTNGGRYLKMKTYALSHYFSYSGAAYTKLDCVLKIRLCTVEVA